MTMSILEPYYLNDYGPEDADNSEVVERINNDILGLMQNELDELSKGRIPILGKVF